MHVPAFTEAQLKKFRAKDRTNQNRANAARKAHIARVGYLTYAQEGI